MNKIKTYLDTFIINKRSDFYTRLAVIDTPDMGKRFFVLSTTSHHIPIDYDMFKDTLKDFEV